ncbi:hypothetical protein [Tepidibacter hydrothermalis]|uniref:Uncharacterized protein n=1 Tax=Tepidibacter hydrothermalis TaxID=3036126 RepID=A0ABY8EFT8_9FIRM|nr:hypothetical protein [Tepidibacter hydrothermalis]WFD11801.1 hypothetical protein P4S50_06915 [Tepidibacter hydrothermalis]
MYKLYFMPHDNKLECIQVQDMRSNINVRGYIRKIDKIIERTGRYDLALNKMMKDINSYKHKLNQINKFNLDRICRKFNELVIKHGEVYKDLHYFRNTLNRTPKTLEEMLKLNKKLSKKRKWRLLGPEKSIFHMYGKDGIFNLKFVSHDGKFEAVYNKKGELLTEANDSINMGTYNYADPDDTIKHFIYDVVPYLKWGNTPNSLEPDLHDASENLLKFKMNKYAKKRYEKVRKQIEGK